MTVVVDTACLLPAACGAMTQIQKHLTPSAICCRPAWDTLYSSLHLCILTVWLAQCLGGMGAAVKQMQGWSCWRTSTMVLAKAAAALSTQGFCCMHEGACSAR